MSKLFIYSVEDVVAKRYNGLVAFPNEELARRTFATAVNSKESSSLLAMYPADSRIECLGTFDDETGEIVFEKKHFCFGSDLKFNHDLRVKGGKKNG